MKNILIVEDEVDISMVLRAYLSNAGFGVVQAYNGQQARAFLENEMPLLVLLDVMLPDADGWEILDHIREKSSCPVMMLTALNDIDNRLFGLNKGADDYIGKPFVGEEVVARVKAVLRRLPQFISEDIAVFGSLKINFIAHEVSLHGQNIYLTPRDLSLLLFLTKHPNQIFSREQLIASVWGMDYGGSDRAVDLAVNRIRQALSTWPSDEGGIVTLKRMGYKFRV